MESLFLSWMITARIFLLVRKITEIKMKPENECKVYYNGEGTGGERRDEKNSRKVKQKSNRKVKRKREEERKQEKEQERMAVNLKRPKRRRRKRTVEKRVALHLYQSLRKNIKKF
jgi:hypothetical protein